MTTSESDNLDSSANLPDSLEETSEGTEQLPDTVSRADFDSLKAENDKLTRSVDSMSGRASKSATIEDMFSEIKSENEALRESVQLLGEAFSNETLDSLGADLSAVQQRHTDSANQNKSNASIKYQKQLFDNSVLGEDGSPILSLTDAPELLEARQMHDASISLHNKGSSVEAKDMMNDAILMAKDAVSKAERSASRSALASAKEQWQIENGVGDMNTGSGSVGGGVNDGNLLSRLGDPNNSMTKDEITQAAEMLRKQGIRI